MLRVSAQLVSHEVRRLKKICNNGSELHMKRFFPPGLALLLVIGSLGHVLGAAFCPRALQHDCCFGKTSSHTETCSTHEHPAMHGMAMSGMAMDGMAMDDIVMDDAPPVDVSLATAPPIVIAEESAANGFEPPLESCPHCLGHSGPVNAPVSFVSGPDQSGKDVGSVPLPVSGFFVRPALTLGQTALPRQHAPPGQSGPRHILISVFLI